MPVLKPISGYTSVRPAMYYLEKADRAIAVDLINIDAPESEQEKLGFDWATAMDATRHEFGNDVPWRGMRVRTYKHYIISPDPKDGIGIEDLRRLALEWAGKHFGDHEVAIVYHDDNESGIPHAHVIVNNTNLETGRRLRDPDPKRLNRSLQEMASEMGLRHFESNDNQSQPTVNGASPNSRIRPRSLQREYMRRAEAELVSKGEYSWTADIRSRVRIARIIARNEAEFRGALEAMGISVADNSPKAPRRDWVYSLVDHPTRRISGEKLGLSYGKERLLSSFSLNGRGHLPDRSEREIARIAKHALALNDLGELEQLSRALSLIESSGIACEQDVKLLTSEIREKRTWTDPGALEALKLIDFIGKSGILPEEPPKPAKHVPASKRNVDARNGTRSPSSIGINRQRETPSRNRQQSKASDKEQQR